jgi:phosphatidylserine/phosphatidylglycerophosphate/cardiolipin synthase-like enzyme
VNSPYPSRDIHAAGSAYVPADLLQALFVAEVIRPSGRLWISSPWISDVAVIDNTARQFATLEPDWPASRIRLSSVLASLLVRGTEVVIIVNEDLHNNEFLGRMHPLSERHPGQVRVIRSANLHEKGILGDAFTLNGSMNLTHNGVAINEELLIYRCDPEVVAERRMVLEDRWRDYL